MNSLETYLKELRDIRSSGEAVNETSYYGSLANLLNEIGKTLKPKVRCIINIKNRGAGPVVSANRPDEPSGPVPCR